MTRLRPNFVLVRLNLARPKIYLKPKLVREVALLWRVLKSLIKSINKPSKSAGFQARQKGYCHDFSEISVSGACLVLHSDALKGWGVKNS
jgi:hypothetical protein